MATFDACFDESLMKAVHSLSYELWGTSGGSGVPGGEFHTFTTTFGASFEEKSTKSRH